MATDIFNAKANLFNAKVETFNARLKTVNEMVSETVDANVPQVDTPESSMRNTQSEQ